MKSEKRKTHEELVEDTAEGWQNMSNAHRKASSAKKQLNTYYHRWKYFREFLLKQMADEHECLQQKSRWG